MPLRRSEAAPSMEKVQELERNSILKSMMMKQAGRKPALERIQPLETYGNCFIFVIHEREKQSPQKFSTSHEHNLKEICGFRINLFWKIS